MKVLHVSYCDGGAGAGIAARRLHEALTVDGVHSEMLVISAASRLPGVRRVSIQARGTAQIIQRIEARIFRCQRSVNPAPRAGGWLPNTVLAEVNRSDCDLIHLHWVNGGMFSIPQLARLGKPVVWTQHDCWSFCGAEHYFRADAGDRRRIEGYSADNRADGDGGVDLDRAVWSLKSRHWHGLDCHFVSPSAWLAGELTGSALFRGRDCEVIPNCIDRAVFAPCDRRNSRKKLGLPEGKKLLLFGAASALSPLKGGELLVAALGKLAESGRGGEYRVLVFGSSGKEFLRRSPLPGFDAGRITGERELAELYNAADVFALPSIIDNLPNTGVEALACGTPVCGFSAYGSGELVIPGVNGCLAVPGNSEALAAALERCIAERDGFGVGAVKSAERYDSRIIAGRFARFYREVLDGRPSGTSML